MKNTNVISLTAVLFLLLLSGAAMAKSSSYEQGYEAGYEDGLEDGYVNAYKESYREGYHDGTHSLNSQNRITSVVIKRVMRKVSVSAAVKVHAMAIPMVTMRVELNP